MTSCARSMRSSYSMLSAFMAAMAAPRASRSWARRICGGSSSVASTIEMRSSA